MGKQIHFLLIIAFFSLLSPVFVEVTAAQTKDRSTQTQSGPSSIFAESGTVEYGYINVDGKPQKVSYTVIDGYAIFQGDIILGTVKQIREFTKWIEKRTDKNEIVPETLIVGQGSRWESNTIHYCIQDALPNKDRVKIAIAEWNKRTSLHLKDLGNLCNAPVIVVMDHINFVPGSSCSSWVGRQYDPLQQIILAPGCGPGQVMHEIGHAAGMWHEQSRPDRDKHVKIHTENIIPKELHNFEKVTSNVSMVGKYDYDSIMHYGAYDFTKNGQPTISTIPPNIPIGQRVKLSTGDIASVKVMYPSMRQTKMQ